MAFNFDIAIVGGTVEGYTSAVYCAKSGLKTLLIELSDSLGANLEELKLINRLKNRAYEKGCVIISSQVHSLECKMFPKIIHTNMGSFSCKAIILAMGLSPKKLGVPLESILHGCGLHYHHDCTISFLKNRTIVVFGNTDTAVSMAITLSALAKKVYLIYPNSTLSCCFEKLQVLREAENIVLMCQSIIYGLRKSHGRLSGIDIIDKTTGNSSSLECQLLYIPDSQVPNSNICSPYIFTDQGGYIVTDKNHKTNISGIFAAGLVRSDTSNENSSSCCQSEMIMAASDGAVAAISAINYVLS